MELLAPAGSFEVALSAFNAGADAVYLGLDTFSARASAANFSFSDLRRILAYAHAQQPPRKVYVAFNTLIHEDELPAALATLEELERIAPDALIVQDLGIAKLVRDNFPSLALHASTQLVAHNLEGVIALKELGFERVVLSREVSIDEMASIARRCSCELEVFVHGALCYSISGLCLFSAMTLNRSGNRGRCAYCCRARYGEGFPFSMRDLRLDDRLSALAASGVASLKIEGRMKSALYVATAVKHYRDRLDGARETVTREDLESVFSRRTTSLYAAGKAEDDIIDNSSLGHIGTPIGKIKRITKDREGREWIRLHTSRALEKHDGLQFAATTAGKPQGMGITEMRLAIARKPVFTVPAASDVEIMLPPNSPLEIKPGDTVYCSASNELKRRFPVPSFRALDYAYGRAADVTLTLSPNAITAEALGKTVSLECSLEPAAHPERTAEAARKAFERTGECDWHLGELILNDPQKLFAPPSLLNELRRALCEALATPRALPPLPTLAQDTTVPRVVRIRFDQLNQMELPEHDELIVALPHAAGKDLAPYLPKDTRLAPPLFTREGDFNAMRNCVKYLIRNGWTKWEAVDIATLHMLRSLGITDLTADWPLYAANSAAISALAALGVSRVVAPPEADEKLLSSLRTINFPIEFYNHITTPLFISLTRPAAASLDFGDIITTPRDNLFITTHPAPTQTLSGTRSDRTYD